MKPNVIFFLISTALITMALVFSILFLRVPQQQKNPSQFNEAYSLVLKDYSGDDVHLYQFRRKVLIAYAWASWCPYCGAELQNLAKEKQKYGDSIDILAINRAEPLQDAKAYTDKLGVESMLTLLLDPSDSFFKMIGGYAMPETVFIDSGGNIIYHQRGPLQLADLDNKIQELLK